MQCMPCVSVRLQAIGLGVCRLFGAAKEHHVPPYPTLLFVYTWRRRLVQKDETGVHMLLRARSAQI